MLLAAPKTVGAGGSDAAFDADADAAAEWLNPAMRTIQLRELVVQCRELRGGGPGRPLGRAANLLVS